MKTNSNTEKSIKFVVSLLVSSLQQLLLPCTADSKSKNNNNNNNVDVDATLMITAHAFDVAASVRRLVTKPQRKYKYTLPCTCVCVSVCLSESTFCICGFVVAAAIVEPAHYNEALQADPPSPPPFWRSLLLRSLTCCSLVLPLSGSALHSSCIDMLVRV